MKPLESLDHADFKDRVGETFSVGGVDLKLAEVHAGEAASPKFRTPLSLLLTAEADAGLEDGVHEISHPDLGAHQLLVSRVVDPDRTAYEIVLG